MPKRVESKGSLPIDASPGRAAPPAVLLAAPAPGGNDETASRPDLGSLAGLGNKEEPLAAALAGEEAASAAVAAGVEMPSVERAGIAFEGGAVTELLEVRRIEISGATALLMAG